MEWVIAAAQRVDGDTTLTLCTLGVLLLAYVLGRTNK